MTKKLLLTAICSFVLLNLSAQVTIGSDKHPMRAALLELKDKDADSDNVTSEKGGLIFSRVKLSNKKTLDPFIKSASDPEWNNANASVVKKLKDTHAGLVVYNMYVSASSVTNEDLIFEQGLYIWDGNQWNTLKADQVVEGGPVQKFFYMPSINLKLSSNPSQVLTCDLYGEYEKQFTAASNSSFKTNNPLLTAIPKYTRAELDFVITS